MVTADIDTGQTGWLTIAVNEGVGGAVAGQTSEELRVRVSDGTVRLMAQATDPYKVVLLKKGGIAKVPASGTQAILSQKNIQDLREFARSVPDRFPLLRNAQDDPVPADFWPDRPIDSAVAGHMAGSAAGLERAARARARPPTSPHRPDVVSPWP